MKALVVCAFALVPLTAVAATEVAGLAGLPNQPFLYVEGVADVERPPDMIEFHFSVTGRNIDQSKANEEAQGKAKKILALLKEAKVEDKDVIALQLRSDAEYATNEHGDRDRGKLIAYYVERDFQVKVRDLIGYPKLINQIIAVGGIRFSYMDGDLSNKEQVGKELWPKAIADARNRAEQTLKPMGMKIDSVFAVSSIAFDKIKPELFVSSSERVVVTGANIPTPPDEPALYRPDNVFIRSSAHVIYLISPAK